MGFFLIGGCIFWSYFAKPYLKSRDARNWNEVPCTIISSQIREVSTRNGPQDIVDIVYAYERHGKKHQSNQYAFRDISHNATAIVNRHPPGTNATCYVNPKDATDAVIERGGFSPDFFVLGVFALMFMLAGFIGLTSLAPPHIARFIERRNLAEKPLVYWGIHVVNVLAKGRKFTYRLVSFGFALGILLLIFAPLMKESVFIEAFTTALAEVLPLLIFIGMIIGIIMFISLGIRSVSCHQQEIRKSSWSTFASSRGLTFVPGKFGKPESYVTGTYRHRQLTLETFERSQGKGVATFTCLSLCLDTPENDSLASCEDASLQDSMSLLNPASPDSLVKDAELKGYILARTVEQTVSLCYVQEDIEHDPEYLGDVLDLLSNLADACSALVASGGEALPFLKNTVARHYHKSIAAELLRAIGRNTTARFEDRAAQVLCASCLTRYTEHKVLLESLEYVSYYGCRNCGQSRTFLEGRIHCCAG
jgi:hypothetical protein